MNTCLRLGQFWRCTCMELRISIFLSGLNVYDMVMYIYLFHYFC